MFDIERIPRMLTAGGILEAILSAPISSVPISAHQSGPGRKTVHTRHAKINSSRYTPHQGERERARRRRQMSASQLASQGA